MIDVSGAVEALLTLILILAGTVVVLAIVLIVVLCGGQGHVTPERVALLVVAVGGLGLWIYRRWTR